MSPPLMAPRQREALDARILSSVLRKSRSLCSHCESGPLDLLRDFLTLNERAEFKVSGLCRKCTEQVFGLDRILSTPNKSLSTPKQKFVNA